MTMILRNFLKKLLTSTRSEEHTSELQSPCISYAVFCLKKKAAGGREDAAGDESRRESAGHAPDADVGLALLRAAVAYDDRLEDDAARRGGIPQAAPGRPARRTYGIATMMTSNRTRTTTRRQERTTGRRDGRAVGN